MSADGNNEHLYMTPTEDQTDDKGYHLHLHFHSLPPPDSQPSTSNAMPVFTSGGGALTTELQVEDGNNGSVSDNEVLGRSPGMMTCSTCQQQVMTNVTYKVGKFAKLLCLLIVIMGLLMCLAPLFLLPIPFCVKKCKDVYHTCPLCNKVLHVDKKQCCKR